MNAPGAEILRWMVSRLCGSPPLAEAHGSAPMALLSRDRQGAVIAEYVTEFLKRRTKPKPSVGRFRATNSPARRRTIQ